MATANVSKDTHPADSMGIALMRATGVLAALTACQDQGRGTFAVGEQFVAQAIAALEGFINDARNSYFDMCSTCDLTMTRPGGDGKQVLSRNSTQVTSTGMEEDATVFEASPQVPQSSTAAEVDLEPQAALPDIYALRARVPNAEAARAAAANLLEGNFATTYDDLLRKLTAAEVFAT